MKIKEKYKSESKQLRQMKLKEKYKSESKQ